MTKSIANGSLTIVTGVVAGAAGGLAEIAWVGLYAAVTGSDAALIAKGITTAAGIDALFPGAAVGAGVAMHMMLSLALGMLLAVAARHLAVGRNVHIFSVAVLLAVWFVNFFVILPLVSPAFTQLLPYAVSLISKLLFGAAAGQVLVMQARPLRYALR